MSAVSQILNILAQIEPDAIAEIEATIGTDWETQIEDEVAQTISTSTTNLLRPVGYANVNSNGTLNSSFGTGVTATLTATGRYALTAPANALTCSYQVLETSARDSIEIHAFDFLGTSIQIHEGDNGAGANIFRNRAFTVVWYGIQSMISEVTLT